MNKDILKTHYQKVNKVVLGAIWILIALILLGSLTQAQGIDLTFGILLAAAIIATIFMLSKKAEGMAGSILCYAYLSYNMLQIFLSTSSEDQITYGLFINICLVSLYMNQKLYLIFAGILDTCSVIYIIINRNNVDSDFISSIVIINLCMIILFFVTKWGSTLIVGAIQKEKDSESSLEALKGIMDTIKENTFLLNNNITDCDSNIRTIKEASHQIMTTMQEATKGVTEQAASIADIHTMINNADQSIGETVEITNKMSEVSSKTSRIVTKGAENIQEMDKQMYIINSSITKSFATVTELEKSMDEVNSFLDGITQIADQTNMLALNAAIEAARAGEQGRGFAVVADEVRKLAEQSSETANLISKIITNIKEKTSSALNEVEVGTEAVQIGEKIVGKVTRSFTNIEASFKEIDSCIEEELKVVDYTSSLFKKVKEESQSIASIAEEQSASIEEMLATLSEQDSNIGSIAELMKHIQKSSESLEAITNSK